MTTYTITAVCPIHNTGSDGGARATSVGEFIGSSNVPSICTVCRSSHWVLNGLGQKERLHCKRKGCIKYCCLYSKWPKNWIHRFKDRGSRTWSCDTHLIAVR